MSTYDCNIYCEKEDACVGLTVMAKDTIGDINIICGGNIRNITNQQTEQCEEITVYGNQNMIGDEGSIFNMMKLK